MEALLKNEPDAAQMLRDDLGMKNADLLKRQADLIAAAGRVPAVIDSEELAGKVSDFMRQISLCGADLEKARETEKKPHLEAGRVVDGFFKSVTDPLLSAKAEVNKRLSVFLRAKEESARKERERIAAEERARAEAARKAAEEAERKAADEIALGKAIEAADAAEKAAEQAAAAQAATGVKAAELSRSRGDYGAVASLRTYWDFADMDRAALDLEALRAHLPIDALEKAVRSFVKAGGRELRGVRIFENTQAVVR